MVNPQLEDGYTPIANEILEALSKIRIPGEAGQCLHFIIRKTYGYGKKEDWISLSQFVEGTNLLKPTVSRALRKLLGMNMIIKKDNGVGVTYGIQKDCDKWKPLSKKITVIKKDNQGSTKKIIEGSTKKIPTINRYYKRNITKETIKEIKMCKDNIDVFVNLYYKKCPSLPKLKKVTDSRIKTVNARLKENRDIKFWEEFFMKVEASDFLSGRKTGWVATFDWILKPANFIKIIEGNYDNRKATKKRNAGHSSGKDYGKPGDVNFRENK